MELTFRFMISDYFKENKELSVLIFLRKSYHRNVAEFDEKRTSTRPLFSLKNILSRKSNF